MSIFVGGLGLSRIEGGGLEEILVLYGGGGDIIIKSDGSNRNI